MCTVAAIVVIIDDDSHHFDGVSLLILINLIATA